MPLSLSLDAVLDPDADAALPPAEALGARPFAPDEPEGAEMPRIPAGMQMRPRHRRSRSDPIDWLSRVRGNWSPTDDEGLAPSHKRTQTRHSGDSPERKRHAPSWLGVEEADEDERKGKKEDVNMWTMEEDLFIMDMVEQYGKRWSKIASQMPGRTDNGVRNRFNRMEKAQTLRELRGPRYGYRCRRCGQPKRGHTCPALSATGDATEDAIDTAAGVGERVVAVAAAERAAQQAGSSNGLALPPLTAAFVFESEADTVDTASSPSELSRERSAPSPTGESSEAADAPAPEASPLLEPAPLPIGEGPPPMSLRASEESIDEQKLDDFLRDLQLSAGLIAPSLDAGAPPASPMPVPEALLSNALDYLYPSPAGEYIVPRSPKALCV